MTRRRTLRLATAALLTASAVAITNPANAQGGEQDKAAAQTLARASFASASEGRDGVQSVTTHVEAFCGYDFHDVFTNTYDLNKDRQVLNVVEKNDVPGNTDQPRTYTVERRATYIAASSYAPELNKKIRAWVNPKYKGTVASPHKPIWRYYARSYPATILSRAARELAETDTSTGQTSVAEDGTTTVVITDVTTTPFGLWTITDTYVINASDLLVSTTKRIVSDCADDGETSTDITTQNFSYAEGPQEIASAGYIANEKFQAVSKTAYSLAEHQDVHDTIRQTMRVRYGPEVTVRELRTHIRGYYRHTISGYRAVNVPGGIRVSVINRFTDVLRSFTVRMRDGKAVASPMRVRKV